jgi:subtilisin
MTLAQEIGVHGFAEALVVLKPRGTAIDAQAAAAQITSHFRSGYESHDAKLLKNLTAELLPPGHLAARKVRSLGDVLPPMITYENLGLVIGTVDRKSLEQLRRSPVVQKVVAPPVISLIRPTTRRDTEFPAHEVTWGIEKLGVRDLWDQGFTGKGVVVGHLDTGVDASHPGLQGAVAAFAEFDFTGVQKPDAKPSDSGEHGTHTAGTIAGRAVKGRSFGIAPGATLASAKVIEGGQVVRRILGGMNWIVGTGARILNMSLGFRGYDEGFLAVIRILRERGVLPVVAIGNEGFGTSRSPGNYPEVLSVGASDENDNVTGTSSSERFNRKASPLVPDLVAPGSKVLSCIPGAGYALMSGTSMATPHVAGLAALLMDAVPGTTIDQVEGSILASCRRPASVSEARGNRGLPSAPRALKALRDAASARSKAPTAAANASGRRARSRRRTAG